MLIALSTISIMFFKLSKKAQNLLLFCLNSYLGVCTFKKKKTGRNSVVERNKVPNRGEVVRVNAESKHSGEWEKNRERGSTQVGSRGRIYISNR